MKLQDKTDVYKEQIEPLMDKIREICEFHDVPFFFTANNIQDMEKADSVIDSHNASTNYDPDIHLITQIRAANIGTRIAEAMCAVMQIAQHMPDQDDEKEERTH